VPEFVWGLSKESKKKLLSGIFDTDGWKVNTCENTYGVQLANKELVEDLRHIAIDCGYKVTNVVANKARVGGIIDGRQIVSKGSYSFCWTEKHNQNKTARGLLEDGSRPRVNIKLPDGFQLQKVVAIELSGHEEVYDISVQEHHNFIADGIVVHNSWSADVPSPARKQVGGNMVPNGDFEKTISLVAGNISGWGTGIGFAGAGTTITMGTDDTNYYKVTWGTAGGYIDNLGTLFNANPNTSYRLKFRMRRQYISGDATAGVSVGVYQYNGAKELWDAGTVGTSRSLNFKDSTDGWVEYEYTFTSQSYTRYIGINIRNYAHQGAGTLKIHFDVDDITLLPTTPVTRTAV
jgi:hypothetical protein